MFRFVASLLLVAALAGHSQSPTPPPPAPKPAAAQGAGPAARPPRPAAGRPDDLRYDFRSMDNRMSYFVGLMTARNVLRMRVKADTALVVRGIVEGAGAMALVNTEAERAAVTIGVEAVADMRRAGAKVDPGLVAAGYRDALPGGKLAMSPIHIRHCDRAFRMLLSMATTDTRSPNRRLQIALEIAARYMQAHKKRPGVVELPSGLHYEVLAPGAGPVVGAAKAVVCRFTATLSDGAEVDTTHGEKPVALSVASMPKGLAQGVRLMRVGARWRITIPPSLARPNQALVSKTPTYTVLVYDITVTGTAAAGGDAPVPVTPGTGGPPAGANRKPSLPPVGNPAPGAPAGDGKRAP